MVICLWWKSQIPRLTYNWHLRIFNVPIQNQGTYFNLSPSFVVIYGIVFVVVVVTFTIKSSKYVENKGNRFWFIYHPASKRKKYLVGLGRWPAVRELTMQGRGPEVGSPEFLQKAGMVIHVCNPFASLVFALNSCYLFPYFFSRLQQQNTMFLCRKS